MSKQRKKPEGREDIYSIEKLKGIYIELLKRGAHLHLMKKLSKLEKGIILRHDLDSEMESSLIVAKMEHELGIKSSYFFRLTCRFYNLYCPHCRKILHEILGLGHEIGLHFDPSVYPEETLEKAFLKEKHVLETILKRKVYSMSLHNPSNTGKYPKFDNIVNAYDWDIFSSENYFSDSGFGFKATVDELIEKSKRNIVQVVFHPTIYCIRNANEPPSVLYISKVEIERLGNALLKPIAAHPWFAPEISRYPKKYLTIKINLGKD